MTETWKSGPRTSASLGEIGDAIAERVVAAIGDRIRDAEMQMLSDRLSAALEAYGRTKQERDAARAELREKDAVIAWLREKDAGSAPYDPTVVDRINEAYWTAASERDDARAELREKDIEIERLTALLAIRHGDLDDGGDR